MGFRKLLNSHRRTRPPSSLPLTLNNTGKNTPGEEETGNFLHEMIANIRDKENGTKNFTLPSNTTESAPHAKQPQKRDNDNHRNFSSATAFWSLSQAA